MYLPIFDISCIEIRFVVSGCSFRDRHIHVWATGKGVTHATLSRYGEDTKHPLVG